MRKSLTTIFFLTLLPLSLTAQDVPKVEVFGGYQYLRLGGGNPAVNENGWNASVAGNINKNLGIAADFSGEYKTLNGISVRSYTYTFGPVVSLNREGRINPFAHALFGGTHLGVTLSGINTVSGAANGFTMIYGGGADMRLTQHLAFRIGQADWVFYRISGSNSRKNIRLSTGIVFRF